MIGGIAFSILLIAFVLLILAICMGPDEAPRWLHLGLSWPLVWLLVIILFIVLTILGPHLVWPGHSQEPPTPNQQKKT